MKKIWIIQSGNYGIALYEKDLKYIGLYLNRAMIQLGATTFTLRLAEEDEVEVENADPGI